MNATDALPKYSLLIPVRTKNPPRGPPQCAQMDEGGEWESELRAELGSERRGKLLFLGVGAYTWIRERRNGLARGIYYRLQEVHPFSWQQILAGTQWRLNNLISGGGLPAYQMAFRANPADLYGVEDTDEDLTCAQGTPISGQSAQWWKPRMMAQEAALREITDSRIRRFLARNKPFTRSDVKIGDAVPVYKAAIQKSVPRWRGLASISDIDETGVTVKFQSRTLKVARFCARRKVEA